MSNNLYSAQLEERLAFQIYEKEVDGLRSCLNNPIHADVVFKVTSPVGNTRNYFGHQAILAARSRFYYRLFQKLHQKEQGNENTSFTIPPPFNSTSCEDLEIDEEGRFVILIDKFHHESFSFIMEFIYTDRLRTPPFELELLRDIAVLSSLLELTQLDQHLIPKRKKSEITSDLPIQQDEKSLWSDMSELLTSLSNDWLSDVTFLVDEKEFPCHKAIMAARSHYFEGLLSWKWKESSQRQVTIHDVTEESFRIILRFIYSNKLEIEDVTTAFELFKLAQFFSIDGMAYECERFIAEINITYETVCPLWNVAKELQADTLAETCSQFFIDHFSLCAATSGFLELDLELLKSALNDGLIDECDNVIFSAIQKYATTNESRFEGGRPKILEELLPPKTLFNCRIKSALMDPYSQFDPAMRYIFGL